MLPLTQLEGLFNNLHTIKCDPTQVNAMVLEKLSNVVEHTNEPSVQFRASSIGKPWVTQILDKWYGQSRSFNVESAAVMYEGRVAQAWAEVVLDLTPSLRYTTEGLVSYGVVQGHYDLCVTMPGGKRAVLEVKSMGGHLVKDFRNCPHDDYGYLSQLSFYYHTLKADYAAFLVRDRTNAKFHVVEVTPHALARKWDRLVRVVEQVRHITPYDVDALLDVLYDTGIPYPTQGKAPSSVKYSKWLDTLYHITADGYVIRPRDELAAILKQIPAARADGVQLALQFPE